MIKRIGVLFFALLFMGSMASAPVFAAADAAPAKAQTMGCRCMGAGDGACQCGKGCQCEHCKTGKGTCGCMAGAMACRCGHRAGGMDASSQKPTDAGSYSRTMNSKDGGFKVTYTSDPAGVPIGPIIS